MNPNSIQKSVTKLVPLLERLSLLRINQDALDRVIRCVEFSNTINELDDSKLANVKPMISPTENQCCFMRNDDVVDFKPESNNRKEITKNASLLVEDYFVTPSKHKHYSDF